MTLSQLARDHGFSESYVRNALIRPLYHAEQIIAQFLGVEARTIWPDRYLKNGKPKTRRGAERTVKRKRPHLKVVKLRRRT